MAAERSLLDAVLVHWDLMVARFQVQGREHNTSADLIENVLNQG